MVDAESPPTLRADAESDGFDQRRRPRTKFRRAHRSNFITKRWYSRWPRTRFLCRRTQSRCWADSAARIQTPAINARRTYVFRDFTGSLSIRFATMHQFAISACRGCLRFSPRSCALRPPIIPKIFARLYLQLPTLDKRITALAQSVTARAANPYDKAMAIENYLRTRYTYTLDLTGKPEKDPLANFLFKTRAGHCEYFASAMTIMLRTIGIPSREVNGFLPGEYNDLAATTSCARATRTAGSKRIFRARAGSRSIPRQRRTKHPDSCRGSGCISTGWSCTWNEWVINYDFAHQVQMAQNMQRSTRNWTEVDAQLVYAATNARETEAEVVARPARRHHVRASSGTGVVAGVAALRRAGHSAVGRYDSICSLRRAARGPRIHSWRRGCTRSCCARWRNEVSREKSRRLRWSLPAR